MANNTSKPKNKKIKKERKIVMKFVLIDDDDDFIRSITGKGYKAGFATASAKPFTTEKAAEDFKKKYRDKIGDAKVVAVPAFLFVK